MQSFPLTQKFSAIRVHCRHEPLFKANPGLNFNREPCERQSEKLIGVTVLVEVC